MKVLVLSHSDIDGGAARAAFRLHMLSRNTVLQSSMKVRVKRTDCSYIEASQGAVRKAIDYIRWPVAEKILNVVSKETGPMSANFVYSNWAGRINNSDYDIVNIHWVGGETMSIRDISNIRKPVVWTFHDMWPFCGYKHYEAESEDAFWKKSVQEGGSRKVRNRVFLDINRWTLKRKLSLWRIPQHIICPSQWLRDCVKKSKLMADWPVRVIPYPLNMDMYKPVNREFSRFTLGLPHNKKIILFGAIGGTKDPRKGYRLLEQALQGVRSENRDSCLCVCFGQSEPETGSSNGIPVKWMGHVSDDATLTLLYSSADVMVVPSLQENLPQTVTEAQSCGCPVVAWNCSGFPDAVVNRQTGYLAKPYCSDDLEYGIRWVLGDECRWRLLSANARKRAVELWSPGVVLKQYISYYQEILDESRD